MKFKTLTNDDGSMQKGDVEVHFRQKDLVHIYLNDKKYLSVRRDGNSIGIKSTDFSGFKIDPTQFPSYRKASKP